MPKQWLEGGVLDSALGSQCCHRVATVSTFIRREIYAAKAVRAPVPTGTWGVRVHATEGLLARVPNGIPAISAMWSLGGLTPTSWRECECQISGAEH